jgi:hypothetical protein
VPLDGHRQHEAVVIIHVLADEVDAAGRAGQPVGRRREAPGEGGDGGGRFFLEGPGWFDGADLL